MKRFFQIALALVFSVGVSAQQKIDNNSLNDFRSSFNSSDNSAMQNALTNNDIKDLALNRDNIGELDHEFTYKVSVSGITDQHSSGRCWMFTSLNMFRPKVMDNLNVSSFEFSQNYLYFWDILEKSNLFLNNIIDTKDKPIDDRRVVWYFNSPVGDGGVWNTFSNLVVKYGVVPKTVMPETNSSSNTSWMLKLIVRKLREDGMILRKMGADNASDKKMYTKKKEMLSEVYKMLALNLGEPPAEFQWRYKNKAGELSDYATYTPQSFLSKVLPEVNFDDYIMIMNDPTREYYQYLEIENYRNAYEGVNWKYVNLPNDVIKIACIESIKNNDALYASCDVGKQLNSEAGIADVDNYEYGKIYGTEFGMTKAERIQTGESGSSHGMALIAVELDKDGNSVKWQFENSWGASSGHNGYLTFTDDWFDEYMFRFVIPKKYLDKKTLEVLEKEVVMLPPWDRMF